MGKWIENPFGSGGSRLVSAWLKLSTHIPIRARGDADISYLVLVAGLKVGTAPDYASACRLAETKAKEMLEEALAELKEST